MLVYCSLVLSEDIFSPWFIIYTTKYNDFILKAQKKSFFEFSYSNLEYSHKWKIFPKSSTFWNLEILSLWNISIYSFIDDYGMDFVIDTIRSIKIEEGANAWDTLVKEYYQDKWISKALTIPH